jgi:hypothetical protein
MKSTNTTSSGLSRLAGTWGLAGSPGGISPPDSHRTERQHKQFGGHQSATESPLLGERVDDNGVAHRNHGSDRQLACRQSRSATAIAGPARSSGVTDRCASPRDEVSRG